MLKIKEKESDKAVRNNAFLKKVITNIIIFLLVYFITIGILILTLGK